MGSTRYYVKPASEISRYESQLLSCLCSGDNAKDTGDIVSALTGDFAWCYKQSIEKRMSELVKDPEFNIDMLTKWTSLGRNTEIQSPRLDKVFTPFVVHQYNC